MRLELVRLGALILSFIALSGSSSPGAAQGAGQAAPAASAQDMEAKGMAAVGKACVQCHNMRMATIQRKPIEQWRDTVFGMIGRGAPVRPEEIEPIAVYLAAKFGPNSPPTSAAPATGSQGAMAANLPDGPGRAVLTGRCSSCHGLDFTATARKSKADWTATIRKMRTLGATVSADEESALAAYLGEHLSPKP